GQPGGIPPEAHEPPHVLQVEGPLMSTGITQHGHGPSGPTGPRVAAAGDDESIHQAGTGLRSGLGTGRPGAGSLTGSPSGADTTQGASHSGSPIVPITSFPSEPGLG